MARVSVEGLPAYSWLGGTIEGTLVLENDQPLRVGDLELALHGAEVSQVTVQAGKSSHVVVQRYPFLELISTFKDALPFQDPEHVPPGTYRFPFRFPLSAEAEPSLATSEMAAVRGRFTSRPDGMYVEYELEARVRVPWWVDPVERVVVPVYSPRRVLGTLPSLPSPEAADRPSFRIDFAPAPVLPGTPFTGSYRVTNPKAKHLGQLSLRFFRHVEHTAEGHARHEEGPEYSWAAPLDGREPSYSGTFQVAIPNTAEATGPFHGQLYRTWWMVHAELEVEFGFNLRVDASFLPA